MARLKSVRTVMVAAAHSAIVASGARTLVGDRLVANGGASIGNPCMQTPYNDVRSLFFIALPKLFDRFGCPLPLCQDG